jgi:hypothetical protein
MLSSIFVALFQAAAGDPAVVAADGQTSGAATAPAPAPRTERRRVCEATAATGSRTGARRCRWEQVVVAPPAAEQAAPAPAVQAGAPASEAPAPATPR